MSMIRVGIPSVPHGKSVHATSTFGHWAAAGAPTERPVRALRVAGAREVIRKATRSTGAKAPAAKQAQAAAHPPARKRSADIARGFRVRADLEVLADRRKTRKELLETGSTSIEHRASSIEHRASSIEHRASSYRHTDTGVSRTTCGATDSIRAGSGVRCRGAGLVARCRVSTPAPHQSPGSGFPSFTLTTAQRPSKSTSTTLIVFGATMKLAEGGTPRA